MTRRLELFGFEIGRAKAARKGSTTGGRSGGKTKGGAASARGRSTAKRGSTAKTGSTTAKRGSTAKTGSTTAKRGSTAKRASTAAKRGSTAKPATGATGATAPLGASPVVRALVMVVAFAGMVAFAVALAKLTLMPSAASVSLTHTNLRPGDSIRAYLEAPGFRDTVKQIGGNLLLGVPFGLLLPVLWPRARGLLRVAAVTALVMVLVELVQGAIITGRAFDIDDVILNTAGSLVGYLALGRRLGRAVHPRRRHWWHRFSRSQAPSG